MTAARSCRWLLLVGLLAGCKGPGYDRIPATAADNPDPLMGSRLPRVDTSTPAPAKTETASSTPPKAEPSTIPTSQRNNEPNRIGPLTYRPSNSAPPPAQPADAYSPGTATLALGAREPKPEPTADQNVRPASGFVPTSDPEVVKSYRRKLVDLGATSPKTRQSENGTWEAVVYFETPDKPDQLRRLQAEGVTEADALLAILEKVQRNQ